MNFLDRFPTLCRTVVYSIFRALVITSKKPPLIWVNICVAGAPAPKKKLFFFPPPQKNLCKKGDGSDRIGSRQRSVCDVGKRIYLVVGSLKKRVRSRRRAYFTI